MLSLEDGTLAVRTARKVIEEYVKTNKVPKVELPESFNGLSGVFVTLKEGGELRGCIGYPYPDLPLSKALADAAVQAATQDPRFPMVRSAELDRISVEVTVLSEPELLKAKPVDRPKRLVVGRDGIIVEYGLYRGLLLPQVPVEQGWGPEEYLEYGCLKAGISPDMWVDDRAKIYTFQGQIFQETSPNGEVVEEKTDPSLDKCKIQDKT
ncbi:MAG TPA: TIGR00296 family protein [Methanocella sp.]|uniref:TIGR00296 family protein n=1 Tax=Methanocella sp. TaxID=2052833 RepID=UPI002B62979D|nr:TIGR00296 family protein [Methanocella sp.]HTY89719.1 TIGR00296 family protein [Methanocella sp.]